MRSSKCKACGNTCAEHSSVCADCFHDPCIAPSGSKCRGECWDNPDNVSKFHERSETLHTRQAVEQSQECVKMLRNAVFKELENLADGDFADLDFGRIGLHDVLLVSSFSKGNSFEVVLTNAPRDLTDRIASDFDNFFGFKIRVKSINT